MLSCMSSMYILDINCLSNMLLCDLVTKLCWLLWPHGLQPARLLYTWDFPGKDTGVACHFLLQGIFPTQGSNPHLLHCSSLLHYRWFLYQLSHQGKLANASFANIFFHSVGCLHFLIVSFSVQKFFSWIWSHLFIFAFISIAQEIDVKKYS